jgi:hypothetical protein
VDPRGSLGDMEEKILDPTGICELRPLGRPARSQSRYRLRYPGTLSRPSLQTNSMINSTSSFYNQQVPSQRIAPYLEDSGHDNVLPSQGYHTPQETAIH